MVRVGIAWVALAGLAVSGCASSGASIGAVDTRLFTPEAGRLPTPQEADLFVSARTYRIGPFDKLTYSVFGIKELAGEVQADASGRISIPLIGTVEAAGRTPNELAQIIAAELKKKYIRDPQVAVNLEETVSQVVTVDGQVREPGIFPVVGEMTLMRAIATAKGLSDSARQDNVVIFRTVEGKRYAGLYNLAAIRRGTYVDPQLFPNDVVVVGQSRARQIFKDAALLSPALLSPLILLLR